MAKNYKRYPMLFRERVVERMKLGENVSQLARELGSDRLELMCFVGYSCSPVLES